MQTAAAKQSMERSGIKLRGGCAELHRECSFKFVIILYIKVIIY